MRKRPLGQNFLVDSEIAHNIITLANIQPEDHVVEIGPGKGVLTQRLLSIARSLTAIELDPKLCRELENRFSDSSSFKVIEKEIRELITKKDSAISTSSAKKENAQTKLLTPTNH